MFTIFISAAFSYFVILYFTLLQWDLAVKLVGLKRDTENETQKTFSSLTFEGSIEV